MLSLERLDQKRSVVLCTAREREVAFAGASMMRHAKWLGIQTLARRLPRLVQRPLHS